MNILKAILLVSLTIIYLSGCSGNKTEQAAVAFPDSIIDTQVIATVNDYPIQGKELRTFSAMFGGGRLPNLSKREYNERILDEYIRRILLWKEAVSAGADVTDSTTQAVFDEFEQSIGGKPVLDQKLKEVNIDRGSLLQSIRRDLVIRQFLDFHFGEKTAVDDSEVEAYYSENKDRFSSPDSVHARHILLQVQSGDDDATKQEKRKKIEGILQQAKSGSDFGQLAQQHSEGPSNVRGGDLGFFRRGTMVQPFDSVAFALGVGEISDVVETRYGYHIIKVEEKKEGESLDFEDIKEELRTQMQQQKLAEVLQNHLNQMMGVAIIVRNYTTP